MTRRVLLSAALTLLLLMIPVRSYHRLVPTPPEGTLRCSVPAEDAAFYGTLVRKYIDDENLNMEIVKGPMNLDSLRSGAIDMLVLPEDADSLWTGVLTSRSFADGTVWVVRKDETEAFRRINRWITELTASERFNRMHRRFFSGKSVDLSAISQYDNLLRHAADSIGWDWRLIAAVVYNESRFHNEANSHKGALGLMQIRSSRYTAEQLLDPATNLSIGTRYLKKLEKMFPSPVPMESVKFALAAYNIGEGKVGQLIERAREAGLDPDLWESAASMLPERHHTVAYVENVLDTYSYYSRIYPR